jgi:queuosine precursor transporter
MKWIYLAGFLATIPAANWMIGNVGTICVPDGPCLIPVGFGLMAPSGVLMIGAALVLRDAVQDALGLRWALAAVVCGIIISALIAPPALVMASAAAFGIAELADLAVYTPLRNREKLVTGILASGVVGSIIDSIVFLSIAFGSLDFIYGQILGKVWMTVIGAAVVAFIRYQMQNKPTATN